MSTTPIDVTADDRGIDRETVLEADTELLVNTINEFRRELAYPRELGVIEKNLGDSQ